MNKNTTAIIFSAGLGTRFKPWTDKHPKALALVNGKTLLQRNIEYLQQYGVTNIVVNVHHFSEQIKKAIIVNNGWGSNVIISDETGEVLETGGGLVKAKELLNKNNYFISVNVDVLTDLNINSLFQFYEERKALIAFGVTKRKTSRNILLAEDSQMCGWQNNNTGEKIITRDAKDPQPFAYSCITIYDSKIFDLIKQEGKFSIIDSLLQLSGDHTVCGFEHSSDRWVDVGRPESVAVAENLFT